MKLTKPSFSKKLFLWMTSIIIAFTIIHLLLQYINTVHLNQSYGNFYELTNRFDFDDEASIPTWYSNLLFLVLAITAGLAAFIERRKKSYSIWMLITIGAIVGSIDEVSTVHETGLQGIHLLFFNENAPTLLANAWLVVVPVVLLVIMWFFVKAFKVIPKNTTKLLALSAFIYLSGAIGIDIITSTVLEASPFVEQGIFVAVEEVSELVGLAIIIYAIAKYIENYHYSKIAKSISALS